MGSNTYGNLKYVRTTAGFSFGPASFCTHKGLYSKMDGDLVSAGFVLVDGCVRVSNESSMSLGIGPADDDQQLIASLWIAARG